MKWIIGICAWAHLKNFNNNNIKSAQRVYLYLWKRWPPHPHPPLSLLSSLSKIWFHHELLITWISLFPLFQFIPTSPFPSSFWLHILFPTISYAAGEKTFLLKVVIFFLFSFSHLVLLFVFRISIPTLIDFLLYISSSFCPVTLSGLSLTHARTC